MRHDVGRARALDQPDGQRSVARSGLRSHMHSARRMSERTQYHIELGLQLCDSSKLDAQLPFSIGKPLVYGAERFGGGSSNRA